LGTFIRKRATWLIILFVEEFFTGSALRHYDDVLKAVIVSLVDVLGIIVYFNIAKSLLAELMTPAAVSHP
jgi:Mg/Co/Ni transporter MgtE